MFSLAPNISDHKYIILSPPSRFSVWGRYFFRGSQHSITLAWINLDQFILPQNLLSNSIFPIKILISSPHLFHFSTLYQRQLNMIYLFKLTFIHSRFHEDICLQICHVLLAVINSIFLSFCHSSLLLALFLLQNCILLPFFMPWYIYMRKCNTCLSESGFFRLPWWYLLPSISLQIAQFSSLHLKKPPSCMCCTHSVSTPANEHLCALIWAFLCHCSHTEPAAKTSPRKVSYRYMNPGIWVRTSYPAFTSSLGALQYTNPGDSFFKSKPTNLSHTLELPRGLKKYWCLGLNPRKSELISLRWDQRVGNLSSSPGGSKTQPRLETTALSPLYLHINSSVSKFLKLLFASPTELWQENLGRVTWIRKSLFCVDLETKWKVTLHLIISFDLFIIRNTPLNLKLI